MFDIERALDEQIMAMQKIKPTAIFADGLDPRVILAASRLVRFAKIVIPAADDEIAAFARRACPQLDETRIEYLLANVRAVDLSRETELLEEMAEQYARIARAGGWSGSIEEARRLVGQPPMFAIMAVKLGYADMAFGGLRYGPREFFRPFMRIVGQKGTAFEAGIFVLPEGHMEQFYEQNIVAFGDVAVNARMTPARLADVAVGTCKIARDIIPKEVLPFINGCIVSYSTKGLDEGPSVDMVRKAAELIPGRLAALVRRDPLYATIRIDAEVQISCAISREAAVVKLGERYQPDSPLGRVNVIIAPNLDLGNFLYNMYATRYPTAKKFPVSGGLGNKVVDFSKESTESDVVLGAKANILMLLKSGRWQVTPRDYFFPRYRILAINPGSTSTKVAYFQGDMEIYSAEIKHSAEELAPFGDISEQYEFRKNVILSELQARQLDIAGLDAVVGRGGLIWPVPAGTFVVNERMKQDLRAGVQGSHASNLGGLIAAEIAEELGIPAFIVDPVVVDEVPEIYKITGLKELRRKIISHALSQIATAKRYAEETGRFYREINVIVAHLGGGISIGAHYKGRYAEVNNALDGEGPFTPERSGSLPVGQLIQLCYSGKYTLKEMKLKNKGRGGLIDLVGTSDFREVERRVLAGEPEFVAAFEAMAYQVARWITSLLPAFEGEPVDQVLLTGGLARCRPFVERIKQRIAALNVGVTVYPGENEMAALRDGALRVLMGKEKAKTYLGKPVPSEGQPQAALAAG